MVTEQFLRRVQKATLTMNDAGIIKTGGGTILGHFEKETGLLYYNGQKWPVACSTDDIAFEMIRNHFTQHGAH
jgi:membrane protein implicated in regulation of membrane protease activity